MLNEFKEQDEKFQRKLGQLVRQSRIDAGLSQEKLSIASNVPRTQISRIENAQLNTSVLTLLRLIKCLNIDLQDVYDLIEDYS